ncbi:MULTISPECIES: hypothetical protein [unclassified Streptomyces]|uniref:hypothetical protein n=1 Tax=unclassified Streptomyces TaxID=2593676 RepID=UPI002366D27C|nr:MULTISPECIES: hypothetical protein [unclassified Streptomyces]MDF3142212.1 hypothetical protein [Streptomyces sp. T21Q-yed]WDF43117.1 hypothetical protein PBV52_43180 [Streptomyces sp. T12]
MTFRIRGRAHEVRSSLGQLKHPPEFRIPRPLLAPDQADWAAAVLAEVEAAKALAQRPGAGTDALLGAAIGIWRALRKLEQGTGPLSAADLRQVRRQVHASRQALVDDGLEIQEHDGMPFDSGQSLEALVFQDEPGLDREIVLETVRPSVYFRGERIQMGQVIVGRPAPEQAPGT